jgi:L-cysteine:1D-myo-inositol 2-amino-2-deoxy-alpha-D-glucopyranoside ligase
MMDHHYRDDWEWRDQDLTRALERCSVWRSAGDGDGSAGLDEVRERLDDDLDTPGALAVLDDLAADGRRVREAAALLGVSL